MKNNWGQININFVNSRGKSLRGASSYWSTRNRSAPLRLLPLELGINVDLTPIVLLSPERKKLAPITFQEEWSQGHR